MGEDQKAAVVCDEIKPLVVEVGWPSDPMVSWLALEGGGLPAYEGKPLVFPDGHIPQRRADHARKPQIMVLTHEGIPAFTFVGEDGPDNNLCQAKRVWEGER